MYSSILCAARLRCQDICSESHHEPRHRFHQATIVAQIHRSSLNIHVVNLLDNSWSELANYQCQSRISAKYSLMYRREQTQWKRNSTGHIWHLCVGSKVIKDVPCVSRLCLSRQKSVPDELTGPKSSITDLAELCKRWVDGKQNNWWGTNYSYHQHCIGQSLQCSTSQHGGSWLIFR